MSYPYANSDSMRGGALTEVIILIACVAIVAIASVSQVSDKVSAAFGEVFPQTYDVGGENGVKQIP